MFYLSQVKVWFQNRRTKHKRVKEEEGEDGIPRQGSPYASQETEISVDESDDEESAPDSDNEEYNIRVDDNNTSNKLQNHHNNSSATVNKLHTDSISKGHISPNKTSGSSNHNSPTKHYELWRSEKTQIELHV